MGHMTGEKSSLIPLIDRLNKNPIGLPDTEKLREILNILFDEKEAYVASKFPLEDATISELARITKMSEADLAPVLESMASKGLVMDMPYGNDVYYLLMPGYIGFMEFTFMRQNENLPMAKLAKLMVEYLKDSSPDGMAAELMGSKTQLTRALAYDDNIPVTSEITSYEDAKQIINDCTYAAVTMCYCRHKKQHLDLKCKKGAPVDGICIVLNAGAKFLVRRGFAQEKTKAELLDILAHARTFNLTHVTDNIRGKPSFICNCCHCCCGLMGAVQMGHPEGMAKTAFLAEIDAEKCDYCGDCFTACNIKKIGLPKGRKFANKDDRYAAVNKEYCLGCAACLPVCENEAIHLVDRENHHKPPANRRELMTNILREKRRIRPFVVSRMKRKARKFVTGKRH